MPVFITVIDSSLPRATNDYCLSCRDDPEHISDVINSRTQQERWICTLLCSLASSLFLSGCGNLLAHCLRTSSMTRTSVLPVSWVLNHGHMSQAPLQHMPALTFSTATQKPALNILKREWFLFHLKDGENVSVLSLTEPFYNQLSTPVSSVVLTKPRLFSATFKHGSTRISCRWWEPSLGSYLCALWRTLAVCSFLVPVWGWWLGPSDHQ